MSNSLKAMVTCVLVLTQGEAATFGQSAHFDVAGPPKPMPIVNVLGM